MLGMLTKIFAHFASYASILGLYLTAVPFSSERASWHWGVLTLFAVLAVVALGRDIWEAFHQSHRQFWTIWGINRYMRRFVARDGRTVIFSRDLSWGSQPKAKAALLKKARAGELIVYIHHMVPLAIELEEAGAKLVEYGATGLEPRSRFTVVGYGKEGSRVAVGSKKNGWHMVYEFDTGENPVHALADDLIRCLE
ncbi:MAG: hypothetical protein V4808_07880 [Pseudomonadota bacterium]